MKTYREIETGVIEWREVNGESTTMGNIIEGELLTRTIDEQEETYSPWDELLDSGATIEWISDEDKAVQAAQIARDARIAELKRLLADSDFKTLSDYDKPIGDLKEQRQAWRDEIRELTSEEERP